jgi:hypothetical protein
VCALHIAVVSVLMHQFILHVPDLYFNTSHFFAPCKHLTLFHKPTFRLCLWLACMQEEFKDTSKLNDYLLPFSSESVVYPLSI